jgi:creatinine amidohydrolase
MTLADQFYWDELTTRDFATLDPETIAVLPIAATEQHGPHLPVATDSAIADGMLGVLRQMLPADLSILVLPRQAIGKSNEHSFALGTLTLTPDVLIKAWTDIGLCVNKTGIRKLLIINSHGGNNQIMDIVARELRVRAAMLAVTTQWNRFGIPPGLVNETERRIGVHAGMVETSLMLRFRPDLVRMQNAQDFKSSTLWLEENFKYLRHNGGHNMGWMIHDLNPEGAVGNALAGTEEIGRTIAEHQVAGVIELLRDMKRFNLKTLATEAGVTAAPNISPIKRAIA